MSKLELIAKASAALMLVSETLRCMGRSREADAYAVKFSEAVYHVTNCNGNSLESRRAVTELRGLCSLPKRIQEG